MSKTVDKKLLESFHNNWLIKIIHSGYRRFSPDEAKAFEKEYNLIIKSFNKVFPSECVEIQMLLLLFEKKFLSYRVFITLLTREIEYMYNHFDEVYKPPKLFISHSKDDSIIVEKFVTMLEQLGVKRSQMFCSSITGYGIPQGAGDLYDYIRKEMSNENLFVIMMLSNNYYKSPVCLNEMGAAWVNQCEYQSILLPGFEFSEIDGAINPRDMCFSLSDRVNRNHALNEFKDRVIEYLGLEQVDHSLWERFRDKFTREIDGVALIER